MIPFYNIIEMTKLWQWRTAQWLPGAKGVGGGKRMCLHKGQPEGGILGIESSVP